MKLPNGLCLYQFGNAKQKHIVFEKYGFEAQIVPTYKSLYDNLSNSSMVSGAVRYGDKNRSQKYNALVIDIQYEISKHLGNSYTLNDESIATLKNALNDKPKYLFLFSYDKNDNVTKIYYTKAEVATPPTQAEGKNNNLWAMTGAYKTEFSFVIPKPVFYELDLEYASLVDYNSFLTSVLTVGSFVVGDGSVVGSSGGGTIGLSTLTQSQLNTYFGEYNPNFFLNFNLDKFFGLTDLTVSTTRAIVNTTITSNLLASVQITNQLVETTADNEVYLVELGSLNQNENITIINTENNSGIKLTWLHSVASGTITYNSGTGKLYNTTLRTEIAENYYKVNQASDYFLYFSAKKQNQDFNLNIPETLAITKSTSGNLTVKMEVLKSYL